MVAPSLLRSEPQGWRGRPIKVGTELPEGDDCIWTKLDSSPQISALFRTTHLDKLSDEVAAETSKPFMSSCGLRLKTLLASYWPTMLKISLPVYIINYQDKTTVPGWVLTRVDNQNNYKLHNNQLTGSTLISNLPLSHKTLWVWRKNELRGDKVAAGGHHFNIINLLRHSARDTKIGQIPWEEEFL